MQSILYIVATPIGNLDDITLRAIEVLKSVDYIVVEDTRRTGILLQKLQILNSKSQIISKSQNQNSKLISIHEHTNNEKIDWLIGELKSGKSAALVTDAGTPGIADPGGRVVEKAVEAGITVVPIPGPSSLAAILSVTGWLNEPVLFLGYLPKKKGRQKLLKAISNYELKMMNNESSSNLKNSKLKVESSFKNHHSSLFNFRLSRGGGGAIWNTLVLFESPNRINKTIKELVGYLGEDCQVVVGRELTKQFEEIIRGTLGELSKIELKEKGEFVVAVNII